MKACFISVLLTNYAAGAGAARSAASTNGGAYNMCRLLCYVFLQFLLILQPCYAQNAQARLEIGFAGDGAAPECDSSGQTALYAGGMYDFTIILYPNGLIGSAVEYAGITDWSWPEGLDLLIGTSVVATDSFESDPDLFTRIHPEFYVGHWQAKYDSIWKADGTPPPSDHRNPFYRIEFQIPSDLSGRYLCVSAKWNHPRFGALQSFPKCARIVDPCSDEAVSMMHGSFIKKAYNRRNYQRAIEYADSMIALDWRDPVGLNWAQYSARALGEFDDAISYLDLMFNTYHTTDVTVLQPKVEPTEQDIRHYNKLRSSLIKLRDEQQQR